MGMGMEMELAMEMVVMKNDGDGDGQLYPSLLQLYLHKESIGNAHIKLFPVEMVHMLNDLVELFVDDIFLTNPGYHIK